MNIFVNFLVLILNIYIVQGNYTYEIGLKHLYYAKTAYCENQQIVAWDFPFSSNMDQLQEINVIQNDNLNSQSFIGYNKEENQIVISFRGTANARNWLSNLNTLTIVYPQCSDLENTCIVHKGFQNVWLSQKELIIENVDQILRNKNEASILVTGHSLGGAVATHCALYLKEQGYNVTEHITFGAPRIGNEPFSFYIQKMLPFAQRIVRKKDPVPHVPTRIQGFRHFAPEHHYYDENDVFAYNTCEIIDSLTCSNSVSTLSLSFNIKDHLEYLGIKTNCKEGFLEQQQITNDDIQNNFSDQDSNKEIVNDLPSQQSQIIDLDLNARPEDWKVYQMPLHLKIKQKIQQYFNQLLNE